MLVKVLRELDVSWIDEHFKLVIHSPRGLFDYNVLVTSPDLDHGVSATNHGFCRLVASALKHCPVGLAVSEVLNQNLVDIDIDLAVSILVYQMRSTDSLYVYPREHQVILKFNYILIPYILKFELSVENSVLDLFVDDIFVSLLLILIQLVVYDTFNLLSGFLDKFRLSLSFGKQYLLCFLPSVEEDALEDVDEVPHVWSAHVALKLFYQDVNTHHWI